MEKRKNIAYKLSHMSTLIDHLYEELKDEETLLSNSSYIGQDFSHIPVESADEDEWEESSTMWKLICMKEW